MNKFELVVQKTIPWNGMWNKKKFMEWNGNGMKFDKTLWNGMIKNSYGMEMELKF